MTLDQIANIAKNHHNYTTQRRRIMKNRKPAIQLFVEVEIMENLCDNPELRKQVKQAILKKDHISESDHDMLRLIAIAEL